MTELIRPFNLNFVGIDYSSLSVYILCILHAYNKLIKYMYIVNAFAKINMMFRVSVFIPMSRGKVTFHNEIFVAQAFTENIKISNTMLRNDT